MTTTHIPGEPLIEIRNLVKSFSAKAGLLGSLSGNVKLVRAVNDVSFTIRRGEVIGIAGESGCGKSTTAKMLVKLFDPTSGSIIVNGKDLSKIKGAELKQFRRSAQLMFQNPYESLNPRFTVERSLMEPLIIHGIGSEQERIERAHKALNDVHLRPSDNYVSKFPHQLSGGQLQRVVLARAMMLEPDFLVADEPVSMLDVSVRAGVLNTLKQLSIERGLTVVYISHDLSLIQYLCETTAIMYLGSLVEIGPTRKVIQNPRHPYTQALIAAIPVPDPHRAEQVIPIKGGIPSALNIPSGCPFHPRCPHTMPICTEQMPAPVVIDGVSVSCHLNNGAGAPPVPRIHMAAP